MIDQHNVKNVILDLGGVLLDYNPQKTFSALKRILTPENSEEIQWDEIPEIVVAMETGRWTKHEFLEYIKRVCKPDVIEEEIIDAWCAMIQEFPHERVEMVKTLSEKYKVYMLSNTNALHIKYFEKEFKNRYHCSLQHLFSKVYYSSEIGFRKPDAESFLHVLTDAGIKAEETIFIDDREDNCQAAESLGMQSLKVPENSGLEAVIDHLI
jgi:putative hydrolase of the HAD superfamily